ncbi:MAG: PAS domain S-box protein [Sulfuritalea sp.]|jgi:PAS domain S-box-containing protein|nr:PAS domain S-box protein [Sulfuritalea sp.]
MTLRTDGATILIVDDQPANLRVVGDLLEERGYRVLIAQDGEEGMQRAQLARPDLILLDVMLPGKDGFEICRSLKADATTREIPIIFMTALASIEHKVKGFQAGGVDYLTKPLQLDEALARVGTQLELHAAQRQLAEQNAQLEQRIAERTAELAERERQFRSLAENLPDNVLRHDRGCRMLYLNPQLEALWGAAAHGLIGKTPLEAFPDGRYADYQACLETVIETGQPAEIEITLPDSGEGVRYHHIRFAAERGANGEVVGVLALGRDVTERRRADRELLLLNRAVNAATDAVFLMDERGRFVYVNDAACRGLGYSRDELLTMSPLDIDADISPEVFAGLLRGIFAVGPTAGFVESRHRARDGRIFPVELSTSLIESDGVKFCLVVTRDITSRRRMEDALHFVAQRGWVADGKSFFDALAQYLGQTLGVDYVVIDKLGEAPGSAETLALYAKGGIVPNMRYSLAGTPCDNVMGRSFCCYPRGIQQLFPEDSLLVDMGAESYAGTPLWDSAGQPLGLIAILDGKPLEDESVVVQLLQLVAPRAAAELERERSDGLLRVREREFRSLAESSPDCIIRYDLDGRMLYLNSELLRQMGLADATEVIGKLPCEVWPDGRYADIDRAIAQAMETEAEASIEIAAPTADGEPGFFEIRVVPERDAVGTMIGAIALGRDITELKRAEQSLLARELEFRSLAENAPDNIARYDAQGRHVYINRRLAETLGWDVHDVLGKTHDELNPDWDSSTVLKVIETGELVEVEVTIPDAGAGVRYHSVRYVAERGPQGEITGVLGIGRDITAYRLAEEERLVHLRYFESMDRIDRAIQGANDLEDMTRDTLDVVLAVFGCDRASLMYPCDPEATEWSVPMERTKPEYPGVLPLGQSFPMDEEGAAGLRFLLDRDGPVKFCPGGDIPLPTEVSKLVGFKSLMSMAVYPRGDKPWQFGIHQCSYARVWTADEERLLHEIGRRLSDGLTGLLAHRRVQESEAHLRTLVQTIPDLVWLKDPEGVFLHCNPQFERLFGVAAADIIGKTDHDFVDRELADFFRANDRRAAAVGKSTINEEWLTFAADGYRGLFETVKTPLRGNTGKLIGVLGVARDITERRAMEDALRTSEQQFRALAENSPDPIYRYDRDCRCLYVNPVVSRIIGRSVEELIGSTPADDAIVVSAESRKLMDVVRQVFDRGESYRVDLDYVLKDGQHHDYDMLIVPERDADGRVATVLALARDVTVIREAERRLKESRRQLRDLAKSREAAREDERRSIARELHDELGQQLSALRIGVGVLDFQFGKDHPGLHGAAANLLGMVDKTIQVTRNVSSSLRPAVLDMGIVPSLEWLATEFSRHTGISCDLKVPSCDVRMPEEKAVAAFRIVQESLTNAARHAHAGRIQIVFDCAAKVYVIEIKDDGVGFDADSPRKQNSFGLVGIHERALAVGGEVEVSSAPGWGTVVRVRIPVAAGKEDEL